MSKISLAPLLLLMALLLSGCATKPSSVDISQRQESLPLQSWKISARMAFKGPEDSFSATLDWQRRDGRSVIRLSKLLGGTLFVLETGAQGSVLTMDGETWHDTDAQRMLYHLTGWLIPVRQLHQWIQGLPGDTKNHRNITYNPDGTLNSLITRNGWQVSYQDYMAAGNLILPKSLTVKRNQLRIKLRIHDWQI